MATKLFVGSLPYSVTDDQLKALFEEVAPVASAKVIFDRETNRSRGFGFVEYDDDAKAQEAISKLNGKEIDGRGITVNVARPREERPGGFGGGQRNNNWR